MTNQKKIILSEFNSRDDRLVISNVTMTMTTRTTATRTRTTKTTTTKTMTTKTEDYTNNFDHIENGGPNCDVRAVSQFCDVLLMLCHGLTQYKQVFLFCFFFKYLWFS